MSAINRKLLRDLWHMRGQALAIAAVIACGVATFIMSLSTLESLKISQQTYYDRYRFADVFAQLKRAPRDLAGRIADIPGVARVQTRVVVNVTLDVEGMTEPAVGRLISVPDRPGAGLNRLHLRRGRFIEPGRRGEAIVAEAFAEGHGLNPGDSVRAVINGKLQRLRIVGVALSPEYVLQIPGGTAMPDARHFGVFWMGYDDLASAFDLDGAFNDVTLTLMRGASEQDVLDRLDRLIEPYGGLAAHGREDQVSHRFLTDEIRGLRGMAMVAPSIFLSVAAFLLNVVMSRVVRTQREQIASLKAFGYSKWEVGLHYLKFVVLITLVGVVCGAVLGFWLGRGMTAMYTQFYKFPVFYFRFDWGVGLFALLLSLGAGVLGTLGAVGGAVRLPPAEAMRPEPPADYRPTIVERLGLQRFLAQTTRMILRHLERRPVKSLLSSVGISLGTAVLVLGSFMTDAINELIDYQFFAVARDDVSITFVEPTSGAVIHEVKQLPGVLHAEPFRSAAVEMRFGHRKQRTGVTGLPPRRDLYRLVNPDGRFVPLPAQGMVVSDKLAELLHARLGDAVTVAFLEGERRTYDVPIVGLMRDYAGTNAYMDISALNAMLREGPAVSGAYLSVDMSRIDELYQHLKHTPRVAGVAVKRETLKSFNETIAENQLRFQFLNVMFAVVIAFGVVYNTARISLSERARELGTLRVIGFTRGEISAILLGELAVLTLAALPIGMALGYGFAWLVSAAFESELFRIPLVVTPRAFAFAATVTLVAAVVSGLIVRRKLDTLDLVAVLKSKE